MTTYNIQGQDFLLLLPSLPYTEDASISYAKRILWSSLLGAALPHFAFAAQWPRHCRAAFLITGMLVFPMQNVHFRALYWGLRYLISPLPPNGRAIAAQHS